MLANGNFDAWLSNGDGSFTLAKSTPPPSFCGGTARGCVTAAGKAMVVGDFNGDGKTDFMLATGNFDAWLSNGDGAFTLAKSTPPPSWCLAGGAVSCLNQNAHGLVVGDFNHDGMTDFMSANGNFDTWLANGDGSFRAAWSTPAPAACAPASHCVSAAGNGVFVGDFDGDGRTDFTIAGQSFDTWIASGAGDGSFTLAYSTPPPSWCQAGGAVSCLNPAANGVLVGDFDGNRQTDFLSAGSNFNAWLAAPRAQDMRRSTVGRYQPSRGTFLLEDADGSQALNMVHFGPTGDQLLPVAGDWDGDGFDGIGVYDPQTSTFYLKNEATDGLADITVQYGPPGGNFLPVAGDWDGDGKATIGLYDPAAGMFNLTNQNVPGPAQIAFRYGPAPSTLTPLVGDWNNDGVDTIGLYDPAYAPASGGFKLRNSNSEGVADLTFSYGPAGLVAVTGDWDGDGTDTVGVFDGAHLVLDGTRVVERQNFFYLRNDNSGGNADVNITTSMPGEKMRALAGRFRPRHVLAAGHNTTPQGPSWVPDLILYQMRPDTFTAGKTFSAAQGEMSYLADLGITGIVTTPISVFVRYNTANAYMVSQPEAIDPVFGTGQNFKDFVDAAHGAGIRVIIDDVTNGLQKDNINWSLMRPEWFRYEADGHTFILGNGAQAQLDWTNPDLQKWWINMVTAWVVNFGVDGFRVDLEPNYAGPYVWEKIRAATGKDILVMSEHKMQGRGFAFECSQHDFGTRESVETSPFQWETDFFGSPTTNIVDTVKDPGQVETFYTDTLSNHDYSDYAARGRLGPFAYGRLMGPFLPHWFMGEEFNATKHFPNDFNGTPLNAPVLYASVLDLNERYVPCGPPPQPTCMTPRPPADYTDYLRSVKKLIKIRKLYRSIIAPFTPALNQTRIVKVPFAGATAISDLQSYAMWSNDASWGFGTAILVMAKNATASGTVTVNVPLASMGMNNHATYRVTNLMTDVDMNPAPTAADMTALSYAVDTGGAVILKIVGL